jgi:hypothetical protein
MTPNAVKRFIKNSCRNEFATASPRNHGSRDPKVEPRMSKSLARLRITPRIVMSFGRTSRVGADKLPLLLRDHAFGGFGLAAKRVQYFNHDRSRI